MLAYFILVHRFPEQFQRLFKAIYDPRNVYLVHVDKNSGPALDRDVRAFLSDYPNTGVLESQPVLWGGYSLVDAELRGMAALLGMDADWEYFINLSGQDFPLKSQNYIVDYLEKRRGHEFIRIIDQQKFRPDTMPRVQKYVVEVQNKIVTTIQTRSFMSEVIPYIGNQWMIVSRAFCEFVCHDPLAVRYKNFYRNTFIADEGFFQTVMMNTRAHGAIINDDLRAIDWVPDGDIKLRPRTFTSRDAGFLLNSQDLFGRKFEANVDEDILDILEDHIRIPAVVRHPEPVFAALSQ